MFSGGALLPTCFGLATLARHAGCCSRCCEGAYLQAILEPCVKLEILSRSAFNSRSLAAAAAASAGAALEDPAPGSSCVTKEKNTRNPKPYWSTGLSSGPKILQQIPIYPYISLS